ncbi:MAG TPA: threonylcarbamoyl-AMP synthase [Bacteroidetes bacterium]|jgi:L-threonylcarbamoyladenylate synthase|nr:threonylcarbamoyl-AMP synthase [Bacteroidota bacterium]
MSEIMAVDLANPEESVLRHAAEVVLRGGLIVYPTETLYGIGADATNPSAIGKVHEAKERTERKPILMIVDSVEMMSPYVEQVSLNARILMEKLWPGPLTLVLKASAKVPVELTQGSGTIGIRMPSSRLCLRLLAQIGRPLTSTSANRAGDNPGRLISEIHKQLSGIDLFLDAGALPESQPSTVVDVSGRVPRVLRSGAVTSGQLDRILLNREA